jgi:hypothetical protein
MPIITHPTARHATLQRSTTVDDVATMPPRSTGVDFVVATHGVLISPTNMCFKIMPSRGGTTPKALASFDPKVSDMRLRRCNVDAFDKTTTSKIAPWPSRLGFHWC